MTVVILKSNQDWLLLSRSASQTVVDLLKEHVLLNHHYALPSSFCKYCHPSLLKIEKKLPAASSPQCKNVLLGHVPLGSQSCSQWFVVTVIRENHYESINVAGIDSLIPSNIYSILLGNNLKGAIFSLCCHGVEWFSHMARSLLFCSVGRKQKLKWWFVTSSYVSDYALYLLRLTEGLADLASHIIQLV